MDRSCHIFTFALQKARAHTDVQPYKLILTNILTFLSRRRLEDMNVSSEAETAQILPV